MCLNSISFTSFTQKDNGTYKCVIEGADIGVCGLMWWRKLENREKTTELGRAGRPLSCHMPIPEFEPAGRSGDKKVFYH